MAITTNAGVPIQTNKPIRTFRPRFSKIRITLNTQNKGAATPVRIADTLQGNQRTLMTMVEIMRRHGKFDETDTEEMLPGDYSAILDSFMAKREKSSSKKSTKKNSEE